MAEIVESKFVAASMNSFEIPEQQLGFADASAAYPYSFVVARR